VLGDVRKSGWPGFSCKVDLQGRVTDLTSVEIRRAITAANATFGFEVSRGRDSRRGPSFVRREGSALAILPRHIRGKPSPRGHPMQRRRNPSHGEHLGTLVLAEAIEKFRMTTERIVAVGLLSQRDVNLLGQQFTRLWPVQDAPRFGTLLDAIDQADREFMREGEASSRLSDREAQVLIQGDLR